MTVLPTIRRQLLHAVEHNAAAGARKPTWPGSKWRMPRRLVLAGSPLMTAASVAVTIVVAIGAIVLLGNGRHSQTVGSSAAGSRQQLLQTLGVLRTSPTAAARAVTACIARTAGKYGVHKCLHYVPEAIDITEHPAPVARSFISSSGSPIWDLALIRAVPLGSGASVTLFPGSWRTVARQMPGEFSSPPSAPRVWGIIAALVDHGYAASSQTTVGTLRSHGLALLPYSGPTNRLTVGIIVPNRVARITVGLVRLGGQEWREHVTAAVHDNVATVQLNTPGSRFNGLQRPQDLRMTWLGAGGDVIGRTTTAMQG